MTSRTSTRCTSLVESSGRSTYFPNSLTSHLGTTDEQIWFSRSRCSIRCSGRGNRYLGSVCHHRHNTFGNRFSATRFGLASDGVLLPEAQRSSPPQARLIGVARVAQAHGEHRIPPEHDRALCAQQDGFQGGSKSTCRAVQQAFSSTHVSGECDRPFCNRRKCCASTSSNRFYT